MMSNVSADVTLRSAQDRAIAEFITSAQAQPSGLVIEGEAGIGKTTLWLAAADQARTHGFSVLSARIGQAESVLAYTAVADLLRDVEPVVLAALPDLQRVALDRVLLHAGSDGPATDQRVVAAALVSVVERIAADAPVLVAIDDVQWLDPSSSTVVAFAAARLKGRVGVLFTERCEPDRGKATAWLKLGAPDQVQRVRVGPISLGGLHKLIAARLGRSFTRSSMVHISEISRGNPFYALELARAMDGQSPRPMAGLPATLAGLVHRRIDRLDGDVREVLLAAACVSAPTVELLARVTDTTAERVVDLLEGVETDGIISIDGNQVRFSHPLLAAGVYTDANPGRRRAMHRALAEIESQPELKARHLALAATSADEATMTALDAAADAARARGAPAAAAELLYLARKLGGDKPLRRVRAAGDHFQAGDTDQAHDLLSPMIDELRPGTLRAIALNLLAAIHIYDNRYLEATNLLSRAVDDAKDAPAILVQTLISLSFAQGMGSFATGTASSGLFDESLSNAREAMTIAEELGYDTLTSQALTMWVHANFSFGHGVDDASLQRALELEDTSGDVPMPACASAVNALLLAYTGRLDEAHSEMRVVRRRRLDRGADRNTMTVTAYSALIEMWRGKFSDAAVLADEAMEWAEQLGGKHVDLIPLSVRAAVAAYAGREAQARIDARAAIEGARDCDAPRMAEWPIMALGFLDVSLGNYAEALATLEPLISQFHAIPDTEIMTTWWVADAVEAMVAVGRVDEVEPLIDELERNGRRLDRAWMMAVGARCRSMWQAAKGDVAAAAATAAQAMEVHERLPMPFERARTQLLVGQLQRRQRSKQLAAAALGEALEAFEGMGATLWAERVRVELARTNVFPTKDTALTPSEQRVAELAASGMTNRDVAAALFISAKTVETNLSQIYRKLGIRSRAELGRHMAKGDQE